MDLADLLTAFFVFGAALLSLRALLWSNLAEWKR